MAGRENYIRAHCSDITTHAEHIMSDFCCYKLFTLDPAFLHIHHIYKHGAKSCTLNRKCQRCEDVASDNGAHSPNKNANGMLLLFPDAEIIASETNGPMIADVLPTFSHFVSMATCVNCKGGFYHGEQRKEEEST